MVDYLEKGYIKWCILYRKTKAAVSGDCEEKKRGESTRGILLLQHNAPPDNVQGPVVQSVVSLTSSLRVISLTVLADSIYNILIFFAEKM